MGSVLLRTDPSAITLQGNSVRTGNMDRNTKSDIRMLPVKVSGVQFY